MELFLKRIEDVLKTINKNDSILSFWQRVFDIDTMIYAKDVYELTYQRTNNESLSRRIETLFNDFYKISDFFIEMMHDTINIFEKS